MSEVIVQPQERQRVSMPFAKGHLLTREELTLKRMPELELRVKDAQTGEIRSDVFRLTRSLTPPEMRTVDLGIATQELVTWLMKRYGDKYVPTHYKCWEDMVKWVMLPFLFPDRMKHLRPVKSFQSMLEAGSLHDAPQLKLHLDGTKNFYVNSTYYRIPETERNGEGPQFVFEAGADSDIQFSGAVCGYVNCFGTRQLLIVRHRFVNLQANFEYEEVCKWVEDRINTLLPGVVTKQLIWDFQWLGKGKYFNGDEPWPLKAADARALAAEHKASGSEASQQYVRYIDHTVDVRKEVNKKA
jgi:hypothetical protein